jgi:hypothetical protein
MKGNYKRVRKNSKSYLGIANPVQPVSTQAAPKQPTEEKVCDLSPSATPIPRFSPETGLTIDKKGTPQQIAKFGVRVLSNMDIIEGESKTSAIRFVIQFMDGTKSEPHTMSISEMKAIDWLSLDKRCVTFSSVNKCDKIIYDYVKDQLAALPTSKVYRITHSGFHIIEGKPLYYVGNLPIWDDNEGDRPEIEFTGKTDLFDIDTATYPPERAIAEMLNLVNLTPIAGSVILSHMLLNIMRSAFVSVGITPTNIPFLVGETGSFKTTYSTFMTQLYGRQSRMEKPSRLNTTASAFETILSEIHDRVEILDDLLSSLQ